MINVAKIITLTRDLDIVETLITQKNIQRIRCFKRIIVFRVNNKSNKTILKSNNF